MENKPVISTRDRGLSISIFRRDKEGQATYGACLQRSWKDKTTSEWKREQINLFPDELLKLSALCIKAYNDTIAYAQQNRPSNSGGNYPGQPIDCGNYPEPDNNGFEDNIPF